MVGIIEVKDSISGKIKKYKKIRRPIPYIIREMIHFYGNEPFHNILIKDLSTKFNSNRHFIRIAIKNTSDNDKVLNALSCELEKC